MPGEEISGPFSLDSFFFFRVISVRCFPGFNSNNFWLVPIWGNWSFQSIRAFAFDHLCTNSLWSEFVKASKVGLSLWSTFVKVFPLLAYGHLFTFGPLPSNYFLPSAIKLLSAFGHLFTFGLRPSTYFQPPAIFSLSAFSHLFRFTYSLPWTFGLQTSLVTHLIIESQRSHPYVIAMVTNDQISEGIGSLC